MNDSVKDTSGASLVIECENITRTYNEGLGQLTIFSDISLQLASHETIGIVGSSGSGKTTLLNLLGGLDKPTSGEIKICGEAIHRMRENSRARFRNKNLGFVYQFHHLLSEFTALENVMMPCVLGGLSIAKASAKARAVLVEVGLEKRLVHKPAELSGGERQRVAIARALVNEPRCVLMDEPTGNLDETTARGVQDLIESLRDRLGIAFVVVTHDTAMARRLGRMLRLEEGRLIADEEWADIDA